MLSTRVRRDSNLKRKQTCEKKKKKKTEKVSCAIFFRGKTGIKCGVQLSYCEWLIGKPMTFHVGGYCTCVLNFENDDGLVSTVEEEEEKAMQRVGSRIPRFCALLPTARTSTSSGLLLSRIQILL